MISGSTFQSGCAFLTLIAARITALGLHLGNLRISNSQTASSVTHHWVELMQRHAMMVLIVSTDLALCLSQLLNISFLGRNELMQRRIQETDGNRVALQSLIQLLRSRPADTAGSSPVLLLSLLQYRNRSSHGMLRFCPLQRTYAQYGKDRFLQRPAHEPS